LANGIRRGVFLTIGSTPAIQEHARRLRLCGSGEVEYRNESVLGPVRGLRPAMREGAREATRLAEQGSSPGSIWRSLSDEFKDAFTELVLEGSLGDPIYGGNRGGEVWRAHGFRAPMLAYGSAPHLSGGHDPSRASTRRDGPGRALMAL
jgi:hypothetical protein